MDGMETSGDDPDGRGPARAAARDSLFLLTVITSMDGVEIGKARVRNLSATGLMADCERQLGKGDRINMEMRGVGLVSGTIAWARGERIGVAFDHPIDPQLARRPVGKTSPDSAMPDYLRPIKRSFQL